MYPLTAEVGLVRADHSAIGTGGFRRLGVAFGRGARWAIGGSLAGLETSLGRPLRRRTPGSAAGHKRKRR